MIQKLKIDKTKQFNQNSMFVVAEKLNEIIDALNEKGEQDAVPKKPATTRKTGNAKG